MKIRYVSKKRLDSLRRQLYRLQDRFALSASETRAIMTLILFATGGILLQEYRLARLPPPMKPLTASPLGGSQKSDFSVQSKNGDSLMAVVGDVGSVGEEIRALGPVATAIDADATGPSPDAMGQIANPGAKTAGIAVTKNDRDRVTDDLPVLKTGRIINVNTASHSELQALPGIGPAMARRILDYRSHVGRFVSIDELTAVKGIGPKTLEKMRPLIAVEN